MIDTAKDTDIDDGLTDHLIKVIKQWYDYEQDLIGDVARLETIATTTLDMTTTVMKEQQGIKQQLHELEQSNKRHHVDKESGMFCCIMLL